MPKSTGRKKNQREAERRERARNASQKTQKGQNIGDLERVVSTILGGTLLVRGLANSDETVRRTRDAVQRM